MYNYKIYKYNLLIRFDYFLIFFKLIQIQIKYYRFLKKLKSNDSIFQFGWIFIQTRKAPSRECELEPYSSGYKDQNAAFITVSEPFNCCRSQGRSPFASPMAAILGRKSLSALRSRQLVSFSILFLRISISQISCY